MSVCPFLLVVVGGAEAAAFGRELAPICCAGHTGPLPPLPWQTTIVWSVVRCFVRTHRSPSSVDTRNGCRPFAHILTIDDPIKNAEEAQSADLREKLWEWYTSTAYTRLAPGGGVLVIQCMTGDTPVRLPDGTEKRLDAIRAGDEVATFDDGRLGVSTVAAWKSNDCVD